MRSQEEALQRMHFLEAILPVRARDTARLEAELRDLRLSVGERTQKDICDAIEDALSGSSPDQDMSDDNDPFEGSNASDDPFQGASHAALTDGNAVALALRSIRNYLGPEELTKFIIQAAVRASLLDADEVVTTALEAVRGCEMTVQDVVMASLKAATDARSISAHEILRPAVAIASSLGSEVPVIIKEVFIAASSQLDPSMLRSSLLSVLGCARGMGMTSEGIKDLMRTFSMEVKYGAFSHGAVEESRDETQHAAPLENEAASSAQSKIPQQLQSSLDCPSCGDTIIVPSPLQPADNSRLDSINGGSAIPSVREPTGPSIFQALERLFYNQRRSLNINGTRSSAKAAPAPVKRSAVDDEEEEDEDGARPSKRVKTESEDLVGGGEGAVGRWNGGGFLSLGEEKWGKYQ